MKTSVFLYSCLAAVVVASCGQGSPAPSEPAGPASIQPGEQAPLADPGQKNFGGMATGAPPRHHRHGRAHAPDEGGNEPHPDRPLQ